MTRTTTLELLTNEYFWNIGSSNSLKRMIALDTVTIGDTLNGEPYTNITTSNVTSNLFIGNLDGQLGTLSVNGNMSGSVLITGNGTDATTMNLELELDDVNSNTAGQFGSQTQIPTFNVDKYGRVSQVANVTISTTLNLLDTTGDTGGVDLLNGDLKINGTDNQIVSEVSGNTFTLSLENDIVMENLSLSGNLNVTTATTLNSTLTVGRAATLEDSLDVVKASSLHSTLAVGGAATLEDSLDVVKASSLHSTLTVGGAATLESTLDVVKASSLHSTLTVGGAAILNSSLKVEKASSLHSTLTVGGAATLESTLDVVGASSLHSTLTVGGAATLESTLDVVKASSLHSTLTVGGAAILNSSLRVVGVSTYSDNIIAQKDVTINGNIFVRGNLTQVDAETILLSDPLIVIGNSNENTYKDLGFKFIKRASSDEYGYFGWDGNNSRFSFYETANIVDNDLQSGNLGTVAAETFVGNVVQANSFVGPLQGSAVNFQNSLTLDFCGNVLGSVTFFGNEASLDVPLELQSVANNIGSFGNSVSVPTITVDTYGRVTDVSENSISTTLSLLDTNGDTGIVDLLNGDLRVNGTSRKVDSHVVGNTFTLTLPDNLSVVDVSMNSLDVVKTSSLRGTLTVGGATTLEDSLDVVKESSLHSTLAVGGAATLKSTLDVVGASSLHSTLAVVGASSLHSTLAVVGASSLHSTLTVGGAAKLEDSLDVTKSSTLRSTLAVSHATTLEGSLDVLKQSSLHSTLTVGGAAILNSSLKVEKASSLHSTLTVGGAAKLESTLHVVGASSLHSTLAVGGAATLESTLDVVGASSLQSTLTVGHAATLEILDVVKSSSLHGILSVRAAATFESTLYVGDSVNFNNDLVIHGNLRVHGTETKIHTETLEINDNKIQLHTDGIVEPFGIYANIVAHGGEIYLYYQSNNRRWEFNRDLYVSGKLIVSDATTIEDTLDVVKASSLHSTLAVVKASSLHSTLAVGGAATLESTLEVVANITAPQYFVKDNITGNSIELVAPDLSGSYTLTLPGSHGIAEQFLQTNGSGILSWVTPDDSKTIKANIINTADYTTSTASSIPLDAFEISYTPTIEKSTVMLQHKIPYESSIHANQRIRFTIEKSVNGGAPITLVGDDILGPNNATGGTRGIYISNVISTTISSIGDTVTFIISAQLTANTTAVDTDGNTRTAGVRTGPDYGVGTVMLTEFKN